MKIDLDQMNVLVTGASRGIGLAIARTMLETGAKVALHYYQHYEPLKTLLKRRGAEAFQANLEHEKDVVRMFDQVISSFGTLDVVVNNAGIAIDTPMDLNNDDWLVTFRKTLDVNLVASGLLCKLAVAQFLKQQGGRIINIASRASFRGDTPEYLAYAASKGGVVAMTRSLARAYGKQGIKAFTVAPGFVRTDMARKFIDTYGESFIMDDIALEKLTTPADVAPMVAFLASGLADHATGGTFDINAGSYVH